ncbi:hypothetical protein RM697_02170 [Ichthyenterobacterium sp. W332]|uniref:Uncharacterized protein n=1 Tax=Microcosmobacter mediterraneus TaxID=3075607 RepID=A0ABU2YGX8_9FLAO|nr:hypothetical protein [Ichthyenterobacterium sp. W332]MDT0557436.1 hypothetical protein [Ichthyenterobacterium sp. W332]
MTRKFITLLCTFLLICSCDDGDIITAQLEFGDDFDYCEDDGLIFYKTIDDPSESLSLYINDITIEDLRAFDTILEDVTETISIDKSINSTNVFNYRRYSDISINGAELFCSPIPPSVTITLDEEDTEGTANFEVIVFEDDNDGIPWEDEDENLDNDNNPATNPTDTDSDGLPNYLDEDDDGDNVYTIDENFEDDSDDNPFTNPLDTDSDGIPNYLDNDDDGDGVPTRDEERISQDNNPLNDITNDEVGADYLNSAITESFPATAYRSHFISRTFTTTITLGNVAFGDFENIDFSVFGIKVENGSPIERTTIFN